MEISVNSYDHLNGFYRPGLSLPDQLVNTSVGCNILIDQVLEKLQDQISQSRKTNHLILGPPGCGKTHFIRILGHTIQHSASLSRHYTVIQFPEENHRILTFADLLLGMIGILGNSSSETSWRDLYLELEETDDDQKITETILPLLEKHCLTHQIKLLVLLENLDLLFKGQLKDSKNVRDFRAFLTKSPSTVFVGTSAHNLIKHEELKRLPFNLFELHMLTELSESQTISLIRKHLKWNRRQDLLEIFNDLLPRIRALYRMSGGNPRLSLILYELIVNENKWDVKRQIEKLLDQISPFFRDRMKVMTPLEKALLETIALMQRDFKTSTNIAKKLRISPQQTSNLLSKMQKAGYLMVIDHPSDKRSKIHQLKEGFFGIWLSIGRSRQQNTVMPRLVEFLEQWYAEKQGRERKRQQIWDALRTLNEPIYQQEVSNQEQLLEYLSDIGSEEEQVRSKLELACYYLLLNRPSDAQTLLTKIQALAYIQPVYVGWVVSQCQRWASGNGEPQNMQQVEAIITCWTLQKSEQIEQLAKLSLSLATGFIRQRLFNLVDSFLSEVLTVIDPPSLRILLLERVAVSYEHRNDWSRALATWEDILQAAKMAGDLKSQGTVLNNISQIFQDQGEFETAHEYLQQSLEILSRIDDYEGQCRTLNNISTIYFSQGYYEKALESLEQALSISKTRRNISIEGITLSNISLIYQTRRDFPKALEYLRKSLHCMKITQNKTGEGTALNNISQVYLEMDLIEESLRFVEEALSLGQTEQDDLTVCLSLYNRGKIHYRQRRAGPAMIDWIAAYQIAAALNLNDILTNLHQLSTTFDKDELDFWETHLEKLKRQEQDEFAYIE